MLASSPFSLRPYIALFIVLPCSFSPHHLSPSYVHYADLAQNISKPGATQIVIDEIVNSDFVITSLVPPSIGTATMINATTLQWKIPELGVSANEGAVLEFFIKHTANTSGTKLVNHSISYSDAEGNAVTFPTPTVSVDCGTIVTPEGCLTPVDLTIDGCQDSVVVNLGDVYWESQGRICQLDIRLKNVCPGKRVALAVILSEVDANGNEHPRGMKAFTIPAHTAPACRDVLVRCIKFVLPEDLVDTCMPCPCSPRNLRARFIAHPIDTDFCCCESIVTLH